MIQSLPVDCCVLHHSTLVLLSGVPIDDWLLCDVPKLKLVNKFDVKKLKSKASTFFSWMLFGDKHIKCINTSPFSLVFWHCMTFLCEEGGRKMGRHCALAKLPWPQWLVLKWISVKKNSFHHLFYVLFVLG
jgi:hypothetical protein